MKRITQLAFIAAVAFSVAGCEAAFGPPPTMKVAAPPAATLSATTARAAELRSGPDSLAKVVASLPAGASLQASNDVVRGFRRVKTAEGKTGYVEASALTMGGPVADPATAEKPAG